MVIKLTALNNERRDEMTASETSSIAPVRARAGAKERLPYLPT